MNHNFREQLMSEKEGVDKRKPREQDCSVVICKMRIEDPWRFPLRNAAKSLFGKYLRRDRLTCLKENILVFFKAQVAGGCLRGEIEFRLK